MAIARFLVEQSAPLALLLAPFAGSFAGVLGHRLPLGRPVLVARSECPCCGARLEARDLVPLVSWLALRGRCRHCGGEIGPRHPLVEVAALVLAAWAAMLLEGGELWLACGLGWTLLALAAADAEHMILPDALTLPLLLAGLGQAMLTGGDLAGRLLGAGIGWLAFWGVAVLYRRLRHREGLGLGDAKLLAAAGAWCGAAALPGVVLLGALGGLAWALAMRLSGRGLAADQRLPFGIFLALGFWVIWLHGPLNQ